MNIYMQSPWLSLEIWPKRIQDKHFIFQNSQIQDSVKFVRIILCDCKGSTEQLPREEQYFLYIL